MRSHSLARGPLLPHQHGGVPTQCQGHEAATGSAGMMCGSREAVSASMAFLAGRHARACAGPASVPGCTTDTL